MLGVEAELIVELEEQRAAEHRFGDLHEALPGLGVDVDLEQRRDRGNAPLLLASPRAAHLSSERRRELAAHERDVLAELGVHAKQRADVVARRIVLGHDRLERPRQADRGGRVEQRFLGGEVAVDRRDRDAAAPGDRGHRDRGRVTLGDQLGHRRDDAIPGDLALGVT